MSNTNYGVIQVTLNRKFLLMNYQFLDEQPLMQRWSVSEAEAITGNQIRDIRRAVETCVQEDEYKPLVSGAVVPVHYLLDLLPGIAGTGCRHAGKISVVFLPTELAPYASSLVSQRNEVVSAWDISQRLCTAYQTWDFPAMARTRWSLEKAWPTQMWIPLRSMGTAYEHIDDDAEAQMSSVAFVTGDEILIGTHRVDREQLLDLQISDAAAAAKRAGRYFTDEQLKLAALKAGEVGRWPWMSGTWTLLDDGYEESVVGSRNVIGGYLFDFDDLELMVTTA